ncbi:MAG: Anion-transporting ATPase, partial [Thermoleophilia bacterium]|nr:Anion-transporting ATPase [Thermoleophilia bacterium]
TGHGVGLLNMAGVVAKMFPVGPIATEAKRVDAFTRDPKRTGVVLVSLPEELPVTETLELRDQLIEQGVTVAATVLNGLLVDRFTDAEAAQASALEAQLPADASPAVRHALETVSWEHGRCVDQAAERVRLDAGLDEPACVLPYMFAPQLERDHLTALSQWLSPAGQEVLMRQLAGASDGPSAAAAVHAAAGETS